MRLMRISVLLALVATPALLWGGIGGNQLPPDANWYFHVDFDAMRNTGSGRHLYEWVQTEIFEEIREEAGIDLDKEADSITAYSTAPSNLTLVVEGDVSTETRDKVIALAAATGHMDKFGSGGDSYYYVKGGQDESPGTAATKFADDDFDIAQLEDGAYFSFAIPQKVIVTATEAEMKTILAQKGELARSSDDAGAILVLSADQTLLQAGLDADDFGEQVAWNSNIVRNTEQVALLISDEDGRLAITARLLAAEKEMAESLGSIARGLISLQIFNEDLDPEIGEFLRHTNVVVDDTALTVSVSLDPEAVIAALD